MSVALITGSAGLVGCSAVRLFAAKGLDVVGIDNDMRAYFFGHEASTRDERTALQVEIANYTHNDFDIRDVSSLTRVFQRYGRDIAVVVHTAAQPSHDWAAREPHTDFGINAVGTMNLLECARQHCPEAVFLFMSTNKVYGDAPNRLPLEERETRWELPESHPNFDGIREDMPIDRATHSIFGASKIAADMMVQEYGRYFGLRTACFRAGCITGRGHSGAELHGFLAYLMKCCMTGTPYRVFGYQGKQVRDNIHCTDLARALFAFFEKPRAGEVYNIGGGRQSNCSMLEAIQMCEEIAGRELNWEYVLENRVGDHMWWISDVSRFRTHYPHWNPTFNIRSMLEDISMRQQVVIDSRP